MTSKWPNKTFLTYIFHPNNLASIQGQRCFCGSWGLQMGSETFSPWMKRETLRRHLNCQLWSQLYTWKQLSASEGSVTDIFGFISVTSTTNPGPRRNLHPPMCQVTSLQTLVLAVDPEVSHELAPALLPSGSPWRTLSDSYPRMRKLLWSSRSPVRNSSTVMGEKKQEGMH